MQIVDVRQDSHQEFGDLHALVLFCKGCNFRCWHCYNNEAVHGWAPKGTAEEMIRKYVNPMHEGLVFLGGEPTIWGDRLVDAAVFAKGEFGLKVKVFTNGSRPDVVRKMVAAECLDALSVDVKCAENTKRLLGIDLHHESYFDMVAETVHCAHRARVPVEVRTTDLMPEETERVRALVAEAFPGIPHIVCPDFWEHAQKAAQTA